jgi:hypothetical protein
MFSAAALPSAAFSRCSRSATLSISPQTKATRTARSHPQRAYVYGADGEDLMAKLDELGLVAYVGVMPHFSHYIQKCIVNSAQFEEVYR